MQIKWCSQSQLCPLHYSKLYLDPNQIVLIKRIFPQRELHQTCRRSKSIHTNMQLCSYESWCWLCQPWHTMKLKKSCDHTDLDGVVTVADVRGDTWRCHVCAANSLDFCNAAKLRLIKQLTWTQVGGYVYIYWQLKLRQTHCKYFLESTAPGTSEQLTFQLHLTTKQTYWGVCNCF